MPKTYYCDKILDNGIICGERDTSKFIEGRYTTCRACRLNLMSKYNKSKTSKKQEEVSNKIDPDTSIRYLIEDTIKRIPLINKNTIPERIEGLEEDITDVFTKQWQYVEKNDTKIEVLEKRIKHLEEYIEKINKHLKIV